MGFKVHPQHPCWLPWVSESRRAGNRGRPLESHCGEGLGETVEKETAERETTEGKQTQTAASGETVYNLLGYSFSSLGALSLSLLPHLITNNVTIAKLIYTLYIITLILLAAIYKKIVNIEVSSNKVNASLVNVFLNSDVRNLSTLFAVDAFGGSLITQSLLALWFYLRYHVSEAYLGIIFSVSSIITAISLIIAPLIAERIGNLRTMVFTHMVSNVFLILIPLMNSLQWSVAFLLLRQSFSQMDVPTRQALISQIFSDEERVKVYAITNIFRNISSLPGPILVGLVFSLKLLYLPFLISGTLKLGYDNTIYQIYKNRAR